MKHLDARAIAYAESLLEETGLEISPAVRLSALKHLDWVLEQNRTLNLTAIDDPFEAVRLHIVDSMVALPEVRSGPDGRLIDLGTGAGFPGVELALASGRITLLVESVKKKADAVGRHLMQESLDSWISVSTLRAEELAAIEPESATVVTARALASLPSLVELAAPLLSDGGRLVALKGRPDSDEMARGERAADMCGLRMDTSRVTALPRGGETRTIITYVRTGSPSVSLPRRVGLAQRQPLA